MPQTLRVSALMSSFQSLLEERGVKIGDDAGKFGHVVGLAPAEAIRAFADFYGAVQFEKRSQKSPQDGNAEDMLLFQMGTSRYTGVTIINVTRQLFGGGPGTSQQLCLDYVYSGSDLDLSERPVSLWSHERELVDDGMKVRPRSAE